MLHISGRNGETITNGDNSTYLKSSALEYDKMDELEIKILANTMHYHSGKVFFDAECLASQPAFYDNSEADIKQGIKNLISKKFLIEDVYKGCGIYTINTEKSLEIKKIVHTSTIKEKPVPKIETIHISKTQKNIIRVAVIQLFFELTKSFPPIVENKIDIKKKIFSGLDFAKQNYVNIVCLPELCLCEEWVPEIKGKYPDMIIIGGFYKENKNICPIIIKSDEDIPCQCKIEPSALEDAEKWETGMVSGDKIYKYETQFGKFVILICRDFDRFAHRFRESDIDFIFCPAYNDSNKRFHDEANIHVTKTSSYILIANTGKYGGTSIFGKIHKNYFSRLIGEGCKKEHDLDYKLCEVEEKKEEIILADFHLNFKDVRVPTPSDSSKEKISVTKIRKLPFLL